jgi:hypothetical protein
VAPGIGATGFAGLALETVSGTYLAPTKHFPFVSESLKYMQDTTWRRPIRQTADIIGAVAGNSHTEGESQIESLTDVIPYFLAAARGVLVKTGTGPFIYTFTPNALATPAKTLSFTVVRNGIVFGYSGCVVSGFSINLSDSGEMMFNASIVGRDEASQSLPTPTWANQTPFGAGMYSLQIPTASQVFDADTFEFSVDDKAEPNYRLKNTGRGAQFIAYGERDVTLKLERDFDSRTDYDAFKAYTAQAITLQSTLDVNNSLDVVGNVAIKDSYETNIGGQGDVIRAQIQYQLAANNAGVPYTVVCKTATETFTP